MKVRNWLRIGLLGLAGCVLATGLAATAQAVDPTAEELLKRLDRLEQQNQELKDQLEGIKTTPTAVNLEEGAEGGVDAKAVKKIVADYLKDQDKAKKAKDDEAKKKIDEEGFKVGSDLTLKATWNGSQGGGMVFTTPNNDFRLHIGGRFNFDVVNWGQDGAMQAENNFGATAVPGAGAGTSGFGRLQDGAFFRRLRLQLDGQAWEVFEWNMEWQFEAVSSGIPGLDDFWVGIQKVPVIGSVRIGHQKLYQGLESLSSSRVLTFMERSAVFDTFWQEFVPSIVLTNSFFDQHATYQAQFARSENANIGADFGDGQYIYCLRGTVLPIWECEGRYMLHLGTSYTWHARNDSNAALEPLAGKKVRFRARPEMRDTAGDLQPGTSASGFTGTNGNASRLIDTGGLEAENYQELALELYGVAGPLSIQAECNWANVHGVRAGANNIPSGFFANGVDFFDLGTQNYYGYYVTVSYFLTGENRTYDRRLGRIGSSYIARPYTNFWAVRDDDGGLSLGRGAWEVAARYSHVNLNDGPLQGGIYNGFTVGLNWYMCPNVKIQWQYVQDRRDDKTSAPGGVVDGEVYGIGMRTVIEY